MTSAEIKNALARRWPDTEYLLIEEAPESSDRSGRKIDVLAISLWRSRGLELDAIEVKVSLSDWKRELSSGHKAAFWWEHSHRFWVAVPSEIAAKVREDLPPGWGLLSCKTEGTPRVVVKPERRAAKELGWETCVGLMRATSASGLNALIRAREDGRTEGYKRGLDEGRRQTMQGKVEQELEQLKTMIEQFEKASGLDLSSPYVAPKELGQYVAIVQQEMRYPGWLVESVGQAAERTINSAEALLENAKKVRSTARTVSAALTSARELNS